MTIVIANRRKPKFNPRNPDGTFKTIDQMLRAKMTVLEYGRMLAQTR